MSSPPGSAYPRKNERLAIRATAKLMTETWFAVILLDAFSSSGVTNPIDILRLITRAMNPSFGFTNVPRSTRSAFFTSLAVSTSTQYNPATSTTFALPCSAKQRTAPERESSPALELSSAAAKIAGEQRKTPVSYAL